MFASTLHLLQKAQRQHYAVGHFNINNLEIVQGIVQAAQTSRSPVILATSEGGLNYAGMNFLYELALTASELSAIPVALHLDHGKDQDVIQNAIRIGYSSVMIDASQDDFETNVKKTKQIVSLAHRKGVSVEAELGTIGGAEDKVRSRKIIYADAGDVHEFVERTGCDFLAIGIGTSHGAYKFAGKPQLRFDILKQIRAKTKVPLVLHGASGVPPSLVKEAQIYGARLKGVEGVSDSQLRKAIKLGICKINTDTDLRLAFDVGVRKFLKEHPQDFDPRHILAPARDMIEKVVEHRLKLCGS